MRTLIIFTLIFLIFLSFRLFKSKGKGLQTNDSEFLEIGQMLFPNHRSEFATFFNSFLTDKKKFLSDNAGLLEDYNFDNAKLTAIEVIYIFGNSKNQIQIIDWRGEENEKEIETFIGKRLNQPMTWTNVNKFRADNVSTDQRDGNFIIQLLTFIDKDLQTIDQRLVFFSFEWDAYVYMNVDTKTFEYITAKLPSQFSGTNKLTK